MGVKIFAALIWTVLFTCSCDSGNRGAVENDSSKMMDSGIMNNPDTLDPGLDTSVIDTADTPSVKY